MAKGRSWTQEEVDYLEENWTYRPVKQIAKKLNRSEEAVSLKAYKLGLGSPYANGEYLTANKAAKLVGIDSHAIIKTWVRKYGLKARKEALVNNPVWRIKISDLIEWLKENQDKWNSVKLELYGLGIEPDWLRIKRKKDLDIPRKFKQRWTSEADSILISLYNHGLTCKQISERMGRTESGIQRRISRLKEHGALPKCKIMLRWTEREEIMFREMDSKGMSNKEIALELGREPKHVIFHRKLLRDKGLYHWDRRTKASVS